MSSDAPHNTDTNPRNYAVVVDKLCDQFEEAWIKGTDPRIESYLKKVASPVRDRLLLELLKLEIALRKARNDRPGSNEYEDRFPTHRHLLQEIFADSNQPHDTTDSLTTINFSASNGIRDKKFRSGKPMSGSRVARDRPLPDSIGRYSISKRLGTGGFADVYLGHDDELQRVVAIKVPHPERFRMKEDVDRFLTEARIAAGLDHSNIVPVYDLGKMTDGGAFVISKYIEGSNLAERLKQARIGHDDAANLVLQIAVALQYVHLQGLVHRDIKSANILLDKYGKPYLADYGLAVSDHDQRYHKGEVSGTPAYMSPEQVRGESHRLDGRTDIWSLGIILYEMLTGRRPFVGRDVASLFEEIQNREAKPLRQIDDTVPKELERICLKCLAKRMADRYLSARDLADDLRNWECPDGQPTMNDLATADRGLLARGESAQGVNVTPKGLRSFDEQDADFFLQLLPGARDRNGVPESVRFWKKKIENTAPERTFSVGLVYGPSGCGKSSLFRAGVLPRLEDHVVPVFVEAAVRDTESRLLKVLRHNSIELPDAANLVTTMKSIREGVATFAGSKVCVIIDQFEQWLYANRGRPDSQLVRALRQCDGSRLQCILLVRDDFWMAISQFMRAVEIPLLEGENSAAVDLFDLSHARNVLMLFGQAYGRLPVGLERLSPEQAEFIDQAAKDLSQDERVVPIRLSLFAEMLKAEQTWTKGTLTKIGGTEAVGVAFLESTFSSRTSPPLHRLHEKAARMTLRALLPDESTDIRGQMRSDEDLLQASGYAQRPDHFRELIRILDTELRLITPTESPGPSSVIASSDSHEERRNYYQLTHDYLVPSVREWLDQKQKQTAQGRAELLLKQRFRQWRPTRENRFLPSALEWLRIFALTQHDSWSGAHRRMMWRALGVHVRNLLVAAAGVVAVAGLIYLLVPTPSPPLETFQNDAIAAENRVEALDHLDLSNASVFTRVAETLRNEKDIEVLVHSIAQFESLAKKMAFSPQTQASAALRTGVVRLMEELMRRPAGNDGSKYGDVRVRAFRVYSQLAPSTEVLRAIESQISGAEKAQFGDAMLDYVGQIKLSGLPPRERGEVTKRLAGILERRDSQRLVSRAVSLIDKLPADDVIDWFMAAFAEDEKVAARSSLLPYAKSTGKGRVNDLGDAIEKRLPSLKEIQTAEEIPWSFELEFLIQAIGLLERYGTRDRGKSFTIARFMLQHSERLEDQDMLDTVVDSFASLYPTNRTSTEQNVLAPIRRILAHSDNVHARIAAANALGELADAAGGSELIAIATSRTELLLLRVACVRNLSVAGVQLKENGSDVQHINDALRFILNKRAEEPTQLTRSAITAYSKLANLSDANVVYPFLLERDFMLTAVNAIPNIIRNHPDDLRELIKELLPILSQWNAAESPGLPYSPTLMFQIYVTAENQGSTPSGRSASSVQPLAWALAEEAAQHDEVQIRQLAVRCLKDLIRESNIPTPDAQAPQAVRRKQLDEFKIWWRSHHAALRLQH